jgi:hypothetical protein
MYILSTIRNLQLCNTVLQHSRHHRRMPKVFNWWRYVAGLYNSLFTFTGLYGSFSLFIFDPYLTSTNPLWLALF